MSLVRRIGWTLIASSAVQLVVFLLESNLVQLLSRKAVARVTALEAKWASKNSVLELHMKDSAVAAGSVEVLRLDYILVGLLGKTVTAEAVRKMVTANIRYMSVLKWETEAIAGAGCHMGFALVES